MNSFAENKVKTAKCYTPYGSVSGVFISLQLSVQPVGGYITDPVTLG